MLIDRPEYLKQLLAYKDMDLVKIVTGVRRAGKSTLLELYKTELLKMGTAEEQIQIIRLEELENEPLHDYHKLHDHIKSKLVSGKKNYIFLDEIQVVDGFGKVVDSLFLKGVDIYLTGSNSKLLSRDLANQIERQKITIHIYPLSFKEYISAYPLVGVETKDAVFERYLRYGSFPKVLEIINNNTEITETERHLASGARLLNEYIFHDSMVNMQVGAYLTDIYEKILLRDIVSNKKLSDVGRLKTILRFMADNIANITSINGIAKTMTRDGREMDNRAVEKYIDAFLDSFVLYKADRYDIKGKKLLKTMDKYYMIDMGLRYFLLGGKAEDNGRILENVVYLELLRRGYTVNIGKVGDKEVDFVARKDNVVEYYQVAQSLLDEKTAQREFSALEGIKDNYTKFVLTRDYNDSNQNGIKQINVLKWLLGE
ncbi:MAG: ATP-binding protein [Leptospirales bacterium]|nr:ATP-binding protein [Leptospirales bacterium]